MGTIYYPKPDLRSVQTIDQIAGINPTLDLDFANQVYRHYSHATGLREKELSDIVTFTRASSATYFDAKGKMQAAGSDVPRIDFAPATGVCNGLLIEEARTNIFINNGSMSTAMNASITTGVEDPFGGANAVTITATGPAAAAGRAVTDTADTPYTGSVWIRRRAGSGDIGLTIGDNVVDYSPSSSLSSSWVRIALTKTPTTASVRFYIRILTSGNSVDVCFFQLEQGSFATSYTPTPTVSASRSADVALIDGSPFSGYHHSVGTLLTKYSAGGWKHVISPSLTSLELTKDIVTNSQVNDAISRIIFFPRVLSDTAINQIKAG